MSIPDTNVARPTEFPQVGASNAIPLPRATQGSRNADNWGSPHNPSSGARAAQRNLFRPVRGQITLRHWRDDWLEYTGTHWTTQEARSIESRLYRWLEHATYQAPAKAREGEAPRFDIKDWNPNRASVGELLRALTAFSYTDDKTNMPCWLDGAAHGPAVSLGNVLLDLSTRETIPHTPAFFTPYSLPFEYDPRAQCPRWTAYLESILDADSIALLQEWTGYAISGRTDLQKAMFLVGPTRSGKGTYSKILTRLIGDMNVTGPTMSGFVERFGLQSFIGAPLAIFDDVRIPPRSDTITVAVERLLSIIGEGRLDVDRKNKPTWSGVLPTRLMLMSNEVTEFPDASGALPLRMLTIVYTKSFANQEDPELESKLAVNLPGILNWSLDGLDRLNRNKGRFTVPANSAEVRQEIEDAANPVRPFVREKCLLGSDCSDPVDALYAAWAMQHGGFKDDEAQKTRFGKLLRQAHPEIKKERIMVNGARTAYYIGIKLTPAARGFAGQG